MQVGWVKIGDFRQIAGYISKTVQDRRVVSIKVEYEVVCALSNSGIAHDLEWPLSTAVWFADPDFLLECKISAIWRRFPLIFAIYTLNFRHISTSGFLSYWPRKYTTRVGPHVDNSHQVWSWHVHTLASYSVFVCWYVTWPCDLDLCPFDLEQLSFMASHVTNLATKYENPTPIRSWVTSYNVSHWLP